MEGKDDYEYDGNSDNDDDTLDPEEEGFSFNPNEKPDFEKMLIGECEICSIPATRVCTVCKPTLVPRLTCDQHYAEEHCYHGAWTHNAASYSLFKEFAKALYDVPTLQKLKLDACQNTFLGLDVITNRLHPGPVLLKFSKPDMIGDGKRPIFVGFLGFSGNGKSFLIRNLFPNSDNLPWPGIRFSQKSTSSDLHAYFCKEFLGNQGPALIFDSEGLKGDDIPDQASAELDETSTKIDRATIIARKTLVNSIFPRLLYMSCDLLCCPFAGPPRDQGVAWSLTDMAALACARTVNDGNMPWLIIIFNRQHVRDCRGGTPQTYICEGDTEEAFSDYSPIMRSTEEWSNSFPEVWQELSNMFRGVSVIYVPDADQTTKGTLTQLLMLRSYMASIVAEQKKVRREIRNFSTLDRMFKIANTLHDNPSMEIDGSVWCEQDDDVNAGSSSFVNNLKAHWDVLRKIYGFVGAYREFKKDLLRAYTLRKRRGRFPDFYKGGIPRTYAAMWEKELKIITDYIVVFAPCSSVARFTCFEKKEMDVDCAMLKATHGSCHKAARSYKYQIENRTYERSCVWNGRYETKHLHETELLLEFFRGEIDISDRDLKYWISQLKSIYPDATYCTLCFKGLSNVTLTCGHSICEICYKEWVTDKKKCPFCKKSEVTRSLRPISKFAGLRVLSLDGGGNRGYVSLAILKLFEDAIGIPIGDMFDLIVGTSIGAVSALFLGCSGKYLDPNSPDGPTVGECGAFLSYFDKTVLKEPSNVSDSKLSTKFGRITWGMFELLLGYSPAKKTTTFSDEALRNTLCEYFPETKLRGSTVKGPLVATTATLFDHYRGAYLASNSFIPNVLMMDEKKEECTVVSAAMRSCAAPDYFSPVSDYIDGGLLVNNPSELAVEICKHMWPDHDIDILVSVGTGYFEDDTKNVLESGLLTTNLIQSSHIIAERTAKQLCEGPEEFSPFKRFNPKLSSPCDLYDTSAEANCRNRDDVGSWLAENYDFVRSTFAGLISSCIIITKQNTGTSAKVARSLTIVVEVRKEIRDSLSDSLWDLDDKSVIINHSSDYPRKMNQLESPKRYVVSFDTTSTCRTTVSVFVNTPYGRALASGFRIDFG